jgi:O-antigen ligase
MLGEPGGPLYFFRITNFNNPVGLFSNRNHLAIFLASVLPLAFYPAVASSGRHRQRTLWIAGALAAALCLFVFVLATGSRSGALLFFAALLATTLLWFAVDYRIAATPGARRIQILRFGAAGVAVLAVTLFVLSSSRSAGVGRLLEESLGEDLRVQILPQLRAMLSTYFPTGIGFGAFEYAYEMFEPRALLRTTYLNQAHNDVLQFMIEGGVFATGIMVVFAFWFARAGVRAAQALLAARRSGTGLSVAPFAWLALAAVIGGSLGDYPLRTPALMAYVALLCCLLQRDARPG